MLIAPGMQDAYRLEAELKFFLKGSGLPILVFPDTETLPYDLFSPHPDLTAQRLATLDRLPDLKRGVVIVSVPSLMMRLPPTDYVRGRTIQLARGQRLDVEAFRKRLSDAGYRGVTQVMEHGEFAMRGAILDLFPSGQALPVRVDLFDDEIESLRLFDPETQRSLETIEALNLLPAREYPLDDAGIQHARKAWGQHFDTAGRELVRGLQQGLPFPGIEYYLPLFFDGLATLFDYLPARTLCISLPETGAAAETSCARRTSALISVATTVSARCCRRTCCSSPASSSMPCCSNACSCGCCATTTRLPAGRALRRQAIARPELAGACRRPGPVTAQLHRPF